MCKIDTWSLKLELLSMSVMVTLDIQDCAEGFPVVLSSSHISLEIRLQVKKYAKPRLHFTHQTFDQQSNSWTSKARRIGVWFGM
jgi:hypothetical protein